MTLEFLPAYHHAEEMLPLYQEYAQMLVEVDPVFRASLEQQKYDVELANMATKYAPPQNRLYLIRYNGENAGCVGMLRRSETQVELKRLYIRPRFRGHNLGEEAVLKIMDEARDVGYTTLLLDTLPGLKTALKLYDRMGFTQREPYYDCLVPGTIFLELPL